MVDNRNDNHGTNASSDPRDALTKAYTEPLSDVMLAPSQTGAAPSFRNPVSGAHLQKPVPLTDAAPPELSAGQQIDDFEVVRLLGRGAFGQVYLARQISLDRHVALKVSANRGSEGRTMARLEHRHIVQVFSEKVEVQLNRRLLCMQLVPGTSLDNVITALHPASNDKRTSAESSAQNTDASPQVSHWNGRQLLTYIDGVTSLPTALDPSALHDREALSRMDEVEATAWMGARLAEALDFAHHHGVLHRDIKPANILVNSYGQPQLADFNIASPATGADEAEEMFGGTISYMAPEHLDAFNPYDATPPDAVTAQADIYSLGLVLGLLLDGKLPVPSPSPQPVLAAMLCATAEARRACCPQCGEGAADARKTLVRTICRCVLPKPEDRFASGAELAEQLEGCRQLRHVERRLPAANLAVQAFLRRPFLWLALLILLPQILASGVNITYNLSQIVGELSPPQQQTFHRVVIGYNLLVYPAAMAVLIWVLGRIYQGWQAVCSSGLADATLVDTTRRKALRLPLWVAGLAAVGWFPGGVLFPWIIHSSTEGINFNVAGHFVGSFVISGLIGLAYSLCGVQLVVLRVLYPGMWINVRNFAETARSELAPMSARLGWIQALAVSIPLLAVMLLLLLGGDTNHPGFRWLAAGLVLLGMLGLYATGAVLRILSQTVGVLTSEKS